MAGSGVSDAEKRARAYLEDSARFAAELAEGETPALAARAGEILAGALRKGRKVLFCGNGGSAADAQHLAAELVGRLDHDDDRPALAAIALTTDTSALTAIANDFGFVEVFERQVEALGRRGDVLVCLSTSGSSPNVIHAARAARGRRMRVVALVGPGRCPLDDVADVAIHAPGETSGRIQQGHATLGHLLCTLAAG